jgi:hypothetical protein
MNFEVYLTTLPFIPSRRGRGNEGLDRLSVMDCKGVNSNMGDFAYFE